MSGRGPVDRVADALLALAGHNFSGRQLAAIAAAIGDSPGTTLRVLERLAEAGLTERMPGNEKHWRLTARVVQIAIAHHSEVAREETRLQEFNQRYTRSP